ncbi:hypothetical protein BJX63DRAFT_287742 [Aspergillus granulosus]|uniref:Uncharacterized protein n=1 Tax=Aspergillus granulosus TaxID=176169 RepID=A0ABR4H7F5_9EURO
MVINIARSQSSPESRRAPRRESRKAERRLQNAAPQTKPRIHILLQVIHTALWPQSPHDNVPRPCRDPTPRGKGAPVMSRTEATQRKRATMSSRGHLEAGDFSHPEQARRVLLESKKNHNAPREEN